MRGPAAMEALYGVWYDGIPDAITGNAFVLRRARSMIEKTGRLAVARVSQDLPMRSTATRVRCWGRGLTGSLERSARDPLLPWLGSGGVAQSGRALPSHGRGQGFKSPHLHEENLRVDLGVRDFGPWVADSSHPPSSVTDSRSVSDVRATSPSREAIAERGKHRGNPRSHHRPHGNVARVVDAGMHP